MKNKFVNDNGHEFIVIAEKDGRALLINSTEGSHKLGEYVIASGFDINCGSWGSGSYIGKGIDAMVSAYGYFTQTTIKVEEQDVIKTYYRGQLEPMAAPAFKDDHETYMNYLDGLEQNEIHLEGLANLGYQVFPSDEECHEWLKEHELFEGFIGIKECVKAYGFRTLANGICMRVEPDTNEAELMEAFNFNNEDSLIIYVELENTFTGETVSEDNLLDVMNRLDIDTHAQLARFMVSGEKRSMHRVTEFWMEAR